MTRATSAPGGRLPASAPVAATTPGGSEPPRGGELPEHPELHPTPRHTPAKPIHDSQRMHRSTHGAAKGSRIDFETPAKTRAPGFCGPPRPQSFVRRRSSRAEDRREPLRERPACLLEPLRTCDGPEGRGHQRGHHREHPTGVEPGAHRGVTVTLCQVTSAWCATRSTEPSWRGAAVSRSQSAGSSVPAGQIRSEAERAFPAPRSVLVRRR